MSNNSRRFKAYFIDKALEVMQQLHNRLVETQMLMGTSRVMMHLKKKKNRRKMKKANV